VAAGWRERTRSWGTFIVAGALLGVLPLVHAQTLIAGALILLVLALRHRRIEWLALLAVTALVATPRLVQIAGSAHGAAAFGNVYPWLRPGWFANMGTSTNPSGRLDMSAGNLVVALLQGVQQLFTPGWWGFWIANLGVAVPLCFVLLVGAVVRLFPDAFGDPGRRLTSAFPPAVFEFFLASMLVFALCDVVVVSSWDWDNTKLLVYWYLAVGLLAGTLATHWWRRWWRALAATALVVSMLFTGTLVALRLGPWTPPAVATTNRSNTITGPDEVALAAYLEAHTARNAVFLTFGRPNDPVLALAGRPGVMGYYGWLWSYGIDFGSRYSDVLTMYKGCAAAQPCAVRELLRRYHVSYVEIDNRLNDPGAIQPATDLRWWATQGFPVVASTQNITVYDVRGRG